jgi:hypothetical protein
MPRRRQDSVENDGASLSPDQHLSAEDEDDDDMPSTSRRISTASGKRKRQSLGLEDIFSRQDIDIKRKLNANLREIAEDAEGVCLAEIRGDALIV